LALVTATPVEIDRDGSVATKRRFDARDFDTIAEFVIDEYKTRQKKRSTREKQWAEIDRQIDMEPDISHKLMPNGQIDNKKMWMSEMELPLQAQALEVLTADARRMMFPRAGPAFRAHVETTDKYLAKAQTDVRIVGDENDIPSKIAQDNADKLVEGFLNHLFRQYGFKGRCDRINAEAFRYGMGVGRARMETKNVYIHEARGVRKEKQRIPVLLPVSIKNLYLDEPMPSMHSATIFGESHIARDWLKLANLQVAASRGSTDPNDEDGGWMPANVKKLEADKDGYVMLLEMEGDIIVPRKTVRSVVIPGAIVTVAVGAPDKAGAVTRSVIRFRFRKYPFSSYLLFPYHYESASDAYPTSPLMKGRTVQIMAVQALNRLLDSAALKNAPPVGYDKSNMEFAREGGPVIHPYAQWGTMDPVEVYDKIGGDPTALAGIFSTAINFYAELTGILPARLGAQTVSHTTAFAKDAELQRGAVRTVDYVDEVEDNPMERWLDMAYRMGRDSLDGRLSVFIDAYGGFVEFSREGLPENAIFEWFGAGGPAEAAQRQQAKLQSLALALQMDQVGASLGQQPDIDLAAAKREVLREGGWQDVDIIIRAAGASGGNQAAPGAPGVAGNGAGAATLALQNLVSG
jgi:hypothetical protein